MPLRRSLSRFFSDSASLGANLGVGVEIKRGSDSSRSCAASGCRRVRGVWVVPVSLRDRFDSEVIRVFRVDPPITFIRSEAVFGFNKPWPKLHPKIF